MNNGFETKIVGVTFANTGRNTENRQVIIRELIQRGLLRTGTELRLERDPNNPYDRNAVYVIGPDGRQIGNLSKEVAARVSPKIASGVHYKVSVSAVTGGNGYTYGINIRVDELQLNWLSSSDAPARTSEHTTASEALKKGKSLYQTKDYVNAFPYLRTAAELGLSEAQYLLGVCYDFGYGTLQDVQVAFRWYKKSAEQGYADAQGNLAFDYHYGIGTPKDLNAALSLYQESAGQGNPSAMVGLGRLYEEGQIIPQDFSKAYQWYLKAANLGNTDGMSNTGIYLLMGRGVTRDPFEAAFWNRKAAELGHAKAQFNLAQQYLNSDGVEFDVDEILHWMSEAAINGHQGARDFLDKLGR